MRIIAGSLGGRVFETPGTRRTHPMSDKMRGALFNTLGDIAGLTVLDAFAGSGALSYEAVSRGAAQAIAIDIDKSAYQVMNKNIAELGLGAQVKAIRASASGWSDNNPNAQFDIVIAAPPYDDLQLPLVQKLVKHLKPEGLFVVDWPGKLPPPDLPGLNLVKQSNYGDGQLAFYRRNL